MNLWTSRIVNFKESMQYNLKEVQIASLYIYASKQRNIFFLEIW